MSPSVLAELSLSGKVCDHDGRIIASVNEVNDVYIYPLDKLDN